MYSEVHVGILVQSGFVSVSGVVHCRRSSGPVRAEETELLEAVGRSLLHSEGEPAIRRGCL